MSSTDDSSYSVFKQDGSQQFYCRWSVEEDLLLSKAVADHGPHRWTLVSRFIPGRTAVQCSTRWFGALNPNVHKGKWSEHEDQALTEAVRYFQKITKDVALPWNRISENIPYRTGIQCQARWTEALDPAVRKGRWHPEEDTLLGAAIERYGCCWIRVASMIPTRTQRQCRTRWNQIHSQQLKSASTKAASHRRSTAAHRSKLPMKFEYSLGLPSTNEFTDVLSLLLLNTNEDQTSNSVSYAPQNNHKQDFTNYCLPSYTPPFPSEEQLLSPTSPVNNFLTQYGQPSSVAISRSSSVSSSSQSTSLPKQQNFFPNNFSNQLDNTLLFSTDFDFLL